MQVVFGPIISRRFGISLGVDVSPNKKQCNFDCVYCELRANKPVDYQTTVIPVQTIVDSIAHHLQKQSNIDVLTFTANGEPTLYPFLEDLILESKKILKQYPHIKTLILSNGSKFLECKEALQHFDIVKFSLDSAVLQNFKKVDKPSKNLNLDCIKNGIKAFAKDFKGDLIAEVLIVKDINDDRESNKQTAAFLHSIPNLKRIDLSTIDRPSAYKVYPISNQKLYELSEIFEGMNVCIATRKNDTTQITKQNLNQDEIITLLQRRPLSHLDSKHLLTQQSLAVLANMLQNNEIVIKNIAGVNFYCPKP